MDKEKETLEEIKANLLEIREFINQYVLKNDERISNLLILVSAFQEILIEKGICSHDEIRTTYLRNISIHDQVNAQRRDQKCAEKKDWDNK